jgi:hypothetical protein
VNGHAGTGLGAHGIVGDSQRIRHEPQTFRVAISPTDTSAITLILERSGQALPAVTTVVKGPLDSVPHWLSHNLRDFEERRRTGQGSFLSEDILRKEEDRTLANVLKSHVPGIDVVESSISHVVWVKSRRDYRCYPDVYLDGTPLNPPGGRANLIEWGVRDFSAIEFHGIATASSQYSGTGSGCGVLLLWSRERVGVFEARNVRHFDQMMIEPQPLMLLRSYCGGMISPPV